MKLRHLLLVLAATAALVPGCAAEDEDAGAVDAAQLAASLSATSIQNEAQYVALSSEGGGFGQAGRTMKFFIDARDKAKKTPYFINANYQVGGKTPDYAKYHYYFAKKQL